MNYLNSSSVYAINLARNGFWRFPPRQIHLVYVNCVKIGAKMGSSRRNALELHQLRKGLKSYDIRKNLPNIFK